MTPAAADADTADAAAAQTCSRRETSRAALKPVSVHDQCVL